MYYHDVSHEYQQKKIWVSVIDFIINLGKTKYQCHQTHNWWDVYNTLVTKHYKRFLIRFLFCLHLEFRRWFENNQISKNNIFQIYVYLLIHTLNSLQQKFLRHEQQTWGLKELMLLWSGAINIVFFSMFLYTFTQIYPEFTNIHMNFLLFVLGTLRSWCGLNALHKLLLKHKSR